MFIHNFQKFLNEGIRWYSKGKFTEDDSWDEPIKFEVGDIIVYGKLYYNNTRPESLSNYSWRAGEKVVWQECDGGDETRKITHVDYCEDASGYTGQIVKLIGSWPWFQTTNMKKIEGIKYDN